MAIVDCPNCSQKASSLHDKCAHCDAPLLTGEPDISPPKSTGLSKAYIEAQGYMAVLLTVGAAAWYYNASDGLQRAPSSNFSAYVMSLGVIWYVSLRVWMIYKKYIRRRPD